MKSLIKKIKSLTFQQIIYPVLISLLFITAIIVFVYSANYLTSNINLVVGSGSIAENENSTILDTPNYNLIIKKLGLSTDVSSAVIDTSTSTVTSTLATSTVPAENRDPLPIVKARLTAVGITYEENNEAALAGETVLLLKNAKINVPLLNALKKEFDREFPKSSFSISVSDNNEISVSIVK